MIEILDTTLRDGGYVNDWRFGENVIFDVVKKLFLSKVEYLELGFLSDKKPIEGCTIFNSIKEANKYLFDEMYSKTCLMIKSGDFSIEKLEKCDNKKISKIRYIFRKKQIKEALSECKQIINAGYNLFVNPVFIEDYSEEEYLEIIKEISNLKPYAIGIIDSMGTFGAPKTKKLFLKLNKIVDKDIIFNFHCHDNTSRAMLNAIEIANIKSLKRKVIIDSTIYGIGRGVGNLKTERYAKYLNINCDRKYNLDYLEELKENYIQKIKKEITQKENEIYFACAINSCHSDYAKCIIESEKEYSKAELKRIFKSISQDKKTVFDKEVLKKLMS